MQNMAQSKFAEDYRHYHNDYQSETVTTKTGGVTSTKPFLATCPSCGTSKPGPYYSIKNTHTITSCHTCREAEQGDVWAKYNNTSIKPAKTTKPVIAKDDLEESHA